MRKFNILRRVTAAVVAFCALIVASCEYIAAPDMELNASAEVVSYEKGYVYLDVKCTQAWRLYLMAPDGDVVDWAYLESGADSGYGNKSLIVLYYDKNKEDKTRTLNIVLDNGVDCVSCQLKQKSEFTMQDPESPDLPDNSDSSGNAGGNSQDLSKSLWMELPSMGDANLGYYSHSFIMDGKTYRNYTFGWSQKDRVALWVAYPLCTLYTNGSAGRTNAWALDPLLGENSAAPFGGYAGDYARGHQLPSADRQCCYDANAQTFYGTNMTPQLNEHNEGIWSNLESKVRTIANASDTTYVVTGVLVSDTSKKERDSYGNVVRIPDAYYKALLRYSKSSTLGQWNAIAFYLEHRAYTEKKIGKEHSMSIDELEEIIGIDLFINLPARIGTEQAARIEATDPADVSFWW